MPCSALQNGKENKMKKNRKYSSFEKRAYYIGFGQGLQYPSAKSASYSTSLSDLEKQSYLNGFRKSNSIKPSNGSAFSKRRKK